MPTESVSGVKVKLVAPGIDIPPELEAMVFSNHWYSVIPIPSAAVTDNWTSTPTQTSVNDVGWSIILGALTITEEVLLTTTHPEPNCDTST